MMYVTSCVYNRTIDEHVRDDESYVFKVIKLIGLTISRYYYSVLDVELISTSLSVFGQSVTRHGAQSLI